MPKKKIEKVPDDPVVDPKDEEKTDEEKPDAVQGQTSLNDPIPEIHTVKPVDGDPASDPMEAGENTGTKKKRHRRTRKEIQAALAQERENNKGDNNDEPKDRPSEDAGSSGRSTERRRDKRIVYPWEW
jgi:hypothetical protein